MLIGSLLISFICTNFMHSYLLYIQRKDHKPTVSHHAVLSRNTHLLYMLGHFLGGLFFLIFSYQFFYGRHHEIILFVISVLAVSVEYAQAITPAKGKSEPLHNVFALSMAMLMIILLIAAPLLLHVSIAKTIGVYLVGIGIPSAFTIGVLMKTKHYWIPQMVYFFVFYIAMLILVR